MADVSEGKTSEPSLRSPHYYPSDHTTAMAVVAILIIRLPCLPHPRRYRRNRHQHPYTHTQAPTSAPLHCSSAVPPPHPPRPCHDPHPDPRPRARGGRLPCRLLRPRWPSGPRCSPKATGSPMHDSTTAQSTEWAASASNQTSLPERVKQLMK